MATAITHTDDSAASARRCLKCKGAIDAARLGGFYELTRQPSGDRFTLCSLDCLERFVRGAE